jgi:uncharacterized secreted protein with C-terminal beta-propeller domain
MNPTSPSRSWPFRSGVALLGAAMMVFSTGCNNDEANPELARFESCEELEGWIRASALKDIDFVQPPGFIGVPGAMAETSVAMDGGGRAGGAAAPEAAGDQSGFSNVVQGDGGNRSWSSTNVQEDGVDEADFVKNDGDHIFVLDRSGLTILDSWPAEDLHEVARVEIEGTPNSLYFDAVDRVVVFSVLQDGRPSPESGAGDFDAPAPEDNWWDPVTKVTVLDVSDRGAPSLVRESYFDGSLRSSRRVGDKVYVVVTNYLGDVYSSAFSQSRPAARQLVRNSIAADWLPRLQDNSKADDVWQTEERPLTRCEDVYRPNVRTELYYAGVITMDLADAAAPMDSVGIFTRADTVYASADSLYLAMTEYDNGPFRSRDGSVDSRIHKLDISDVEPRPTAAGVVPGRMLNNFSMGEHDDFLRVATTVWTDGGPLQGSTSSNGVYVMEQDGTSLVTAGEVDGLAAGESIYAVRFMGEKAYVVTFEQIDPLFTIDLSDPRNPEVMGELEVTGFSNYLHPMGDDHLIAVGEEISANGWEQLGLQVSLFDVSDFSSPDLADRVIVDANGWSEAQYDHHAFTWYEDQEVLALPVVRWEYGETGNTTGLELFRINELDGIEEIGEVDHTSYADDEVEDYWWYGCNNVRRSIFIEDYVFAVSNMGIQVAMIDTPEVTVGGLLYEDGGCNDQYWW